MLELFINKIYVYYSSESIHTHTQAPARAAPYFEGAIFRETLRFSVLNGVPNAKRFGLVFLTQTVAFWCSYQIPSLSIRQGLSYPATKSTLT